MKTVLKAMLGIVLGFALIAGGVLVAGKRAFDRFWSPDPESIATASLQGLQAQSRLTALVASYVAVVTSTQHRFGLSAQRTLIMPGRVRYEVDLGQMQAGDLAWHTDTHTLDVTLPPLMIEGPEIDPARMKAYDSGGLLLKLTDSGETLDQTNQQAARTELIRRHARHRRSRSPSRPRGRPWRRASRCRSRRRAWRPMSASASAARRSRMPRRSRRWISRGPGRT
jgi:hypothetical protein